MLLAEFFHLKFSVCDLQSVVIIFTAEFNPFTEKEFIEVKINAFCIRELWMH